MAQNTDRNESRSAYDVGRYLVFGAGLGTVVFALTSNAVWIGIGAALGIVVGGVMTSIGQGSRDD